MAGKSSANAVVTVDVYRWHPKGTPAEPEGPIEEAYKGDQISVPAEYLEHGLENDQLAKPRSSAAKAAKEGAGPGVVEAFEGLEEEQLDELAATNSVADYPADGSKADKVAALADAGIAAPELPE